MKISLQFLVLDEADRVLGVNFEAELRVIFQCLPKNRQTLLFSATMTSNLEKLLELSANKAYFYAAYEGFKTVESLKQQYIHVPKHMKDVYLLHVLNKMEEMHVRSAIIFVSTCRYSFLMSTQSFFIIWPYILCQKLMSMTWLIMLLILNMILKSYKCPVSVIICII